MKNILLTLFVALFVLASFSPVAAADPLAVVQSVTVNPENVIVIRGLTNCSNFTAYAVIARVTTSVVRIRVYQKNISGRECTSMPAPFTLYVNSPLPINTYTVNVNGVNY